MEFVGPTKIKLADTDLPRIGHGIGVGEDEIHAFLEVETTGSGYDDLGRPKALFEPHIFYRLLGAGPKRDKAVGLKLAYAKQGTMPYPHESYTRIQAAMLIDPVCALQSASWGVGQVMGFNYVACGYDSVEAMVSDFVHSGEPAQLQAAINFIKHEHLDDELRAHNWPAFARGYNGANYAVNHYDVKLKAAFVKWSKIKDTLWTPAESMRIAMDAVAPTPVIPVQRIDPVQPAEVTVVAQVPLPSTDTLVPVKSSLGSKLSGWLTRIWTT